MLSVQWTNEQDQFISEMLMKYCRYLLVSKYNSIIVRPKASWGGLICRTHQYYHR